jgi:hypothetical protein
MSCAICGVFFAAGEVEPFRTHRRSHGAFLLLEAEEAEKARAHAAHDSGTQRALSSRVTRGDQEFLAASVGVSSDEADR